MEIHGVMDRTALGVVAETVGTAIAGEGEDGQAEAVGADTNTTSLRYY
jgi:hypothetical protein